MLLLVLIYPLIHVNGLEETEIIISGEAKPQYGKVYSYNIEVKGKLYNNGISYVSIYEKGSKLTDDSGKQIKLYVGSNHYTIKFFEEDYGYGYVYYPYKIGTTYIIEVTNLVNKGTFEFTPQPKQSEVQVSEDVKSSLQERSITVTDWIQGSIPARWNTNLKICAGKMALTNPIILVKSDIETVQITLPKSISAESCARQQFQVKAKEPNTIQATFVELTEEKNIIKEKDQKIPEWVRNIFVWYAQKQIGEDDLIQALQFLIKEGILKV